MDFDPNFNDSQLLYIGRHILFAVICFIIILFIYRYVRANKTRPQQNGTLKNGEMNNEFFDVDASSGLHHNNFVGSGAIQFSAQLGIGKNDEPKIMKTITPKNKYSVQGGATPRNVERLMINETQAAITRRAAPILDFIVFDILNYDLTEAGTNNAQPIKYMNIDEIRNMSKTKVEAAEHYKNNRITYKNDGQNVHDSNISKNLKNIYDTISIGYAPNQMDILSSISKFVNVYKPNSRAIEVASMMYGDNQNSISSIGGTEHDVICRVWNRAENDNNNSKHIKENIIDALDDCFEKNNIVCKTGRVSRVLQAVTYLDKELSIDVLKNTETYKNEIFNRIHQMILQTVTRLKNSEDPNERIYGQSFTQLSHEQNSSYDAAIEKKTKDTLYDNITLITDEYKTRINPSDLDKIKNEAFMAIDF